jgi:polyisoprenoid-binding protein YceI
MKKIFFTTLLAAFVLFSAFTLYNSEEWKLTDGYSIRFSGKKANGFFHSLKGKVNFDENKLSASSVQLEVDVASISMGNSLKTWHAKRAKWFDAKKYPTITFVSDKFQKSNKGFVVNGKLKMKGVEKDISVPFSFNHNFFFGQFYVRRSEFNVGSLKGMSKSVADSIKVEFTIPVTK